MATSINPILKLFRGHIQKTIVIRHYKASGKTVLSAYPNMSKVVFSKAQKANQNTFKKAVLFASYVKQSWMLVALFESHFGKEVSVYKQAIKEYFKNPEAPLSSILEIKMQGSTVDGTSQVLVIDIQEASKLAEKHLKTLATLELKSFKHAKTRRHNPNHKMIRLLLAS